MPAKTILSLLRELTETYRAFIAHGSIHIREIGLTPPQFDILATLGNTKGMPFKELGDKTLITKGTLTGVVDRLEAKNLVRRVANAQDGRSQVVQLTEAGEQMFAQHFPAHLKHIEHALTDVTESDMQALTANLHILRTAFIAATKES